MRSMLKTIAICLLATTVSGSAFAQSSTVDISDKGMYINDGASSVSIDGNGVRVIDGGAKAPHHVHAKPAAVVAPAAEGASYTNSTLRNMSFAGKNLANASFTNAELHNINFQNADLRGASFTNAQLLGCDLRGALVTGASFSNATFTRSKIGGVDFSGASMTNADMSGADFSVSSATSAVVIEKALTDASTARINLAVYFDFDKDTLQTNGHQQMAELGKALKSQALAGAHIRIEGHTDAKGNDDYNTDLSYRRAARVMRVLSEQYGIDSGLMEIKGYGETQPVADNNSEFGRSQNRRVTIVNTSLAK